MKFYACPLCGATIREDHVPKHGDWHDGLDTLIESPVPAELELGEWPARTNAGAL